MLCILHLIQKHLDDSTSLSHLTTTAVLTNYWTKLVILKLKIYLLCDATVGSRQNLVLLEINMYQLVHVQSQLPCTAILFLCRDRFKYI